VPSDQQDSFVKELLKYRLLDVAALASGLVPQCHMKDRDALPFVEKLVSSVILTILLLFHQVCGQGHATMGDWPKLVDTALNTAMASHANMALPPSAPSKGVDGRLASCFHAMSLATKTVYKAKIIYNFAAAAFHLCYLLRVSGRFVFPGVFL